MTADLAILFALATLGVWKALEFAFHVLMNLARRGYINPWIGAALLGLICAAVASLALNTAHGVLDAVQP